MICFPHVGGSSAFYRNWAHQLNECEVYSIQYPGRGNRIEEPFFTDIKELSSHIASVVKPFADSPLVFFGHSMGASVALETARKLESSGIFVAHLFASGTRHGSKPLILDAGFLEDEEAVCDQLVKLGGTDPSVINDPVFRELSLPAIMADAKMFYNYRMICDRPLHCPITTIYGNNDENVDIKPWQDITSNSYKEEEVLGDHFYLVKNPPYLLIQNTINRDIINF